MIEPAEGWEGKRKFRTRQDEAAGRGKGKRTTTRYKKKWREKAPHFFIAIVVGHLSASVKRNRSIPNNS